MKQTICLHCTNIRLPSTMLTQLLHKHLLERKDRIISLTKNSFLFTSFRKLQVVVDIQTELRRFLMILNNNDFYPIEIGFRS